MNFKKILFVLSVGLFAVGCVKRNTYDEVRPNKNIFSIKNCEDEKIFSKIDTSAIYLLNYKRINDGKIYTNGLKFYSKNRISFFVNVNSENVSDLNPKKAKMGFYSTCSEKNIIQIAFYHVQSNVFISKQEFIIKNDSLLLTTLKSPFSSIRTEIFIKKELSKNKLIYTPDW